MRLLVPIVSLALLSGCQQTKEPSPTETLYSQAIEDGRAAGLYSVAHEICPASTVDKTAYDYLLNVIDSRYMGGSLEKHYTHGKELIISKDREFIANAISRNYNNSLFSACRALSEEAVSMRLNSEARKEEMRKAVMGDL